MNAGDGVGVEGEGVEARGVAVYEEVVLLGQGDFCEHLVVTGHHTGVTHHFA
jgi:hypothetical protein